MMPTFKLHGNLVHFAAFKNHIGLYPGAAGVEAFKEDLAKYETSKGAIQFPLEKSIPFPLISKIVKYKLKYTLIHSPFSNFHWAQGGNCQKTKCRSASSTIYKYIMKEITFV